MSTTATTLTPQYSVRKKRSASLESAIGGFSFPLLLLFFVFLYSNIAQIFPVLDLIRPAQTVGALALIALLYESFAAGSFPELIWPDSYLLMGFVAAAGVSIVGAVWPAYAFEATTNLIKMAVVYFLIVNTVTTEKRLRTLLWTMVLGGLFPALGSLWYRQEGKLVEGRAAWIGAFANPNEMAYALVILIPLAVALSRQLDLFRRAGVWLLAGVYMVAIYFSFSRGSLLGLVAVFAYIGWRQKSRLARIGLIAALLIGAVVGSMYWTRSDGFRNVQNDADVQERLETYQIALAMYADSPIFGVGINCSSVAWPLYAPVTQANHHKWLITHNTFLEALSETGTAGFLFLVFFYAAAVRRAWRVSRQLIEGRERVIDLLAALEIAFWGFLICGLSGGYVMTWFPYLLAGLIGAASRIVEKPTGCAA